MDHHLLPRNPTSDSIHVPCICTHPYYDGESGSFLTYPMRRQKPWLASELRGAELLAHIRRYEILYKPQLRELQRFYQEWLFFGFLSEVLQDDFRAEIYVYSEAGSSYITTQSLKSDLEKMWPKRLTSLSHANAIYEHISDCVIFIFVLVKFMGDKLESNGSEPAFDWRVFLSIYSSTQLIGASLCEAILQKYGDLRFITTPFDTMEFLTKAIKSNMRSAGWCPSQFRSISSKFLNIQSLVALSRMKRSLEQRSHDTCTETVCKCLQIADLESYKPKHRPDCQNCTCFESSQVNTAVRNILLKDNESIPVLRISGDINSLQVQVVEASSDTKYVAISHIWADGLGNYKANSLPACQIAHLKRLAENLGDNTNIQVTTGETCIWIDTLCCPWDISPAKTNAIRRLRQTYENASDVIVLDLGLECINSEIRPAWELMLWIFCSGWTSRLWTAQEGVLATNLWFQFQDQARNFGVLTDSMLQEVTRDCLVRSVWSDVINQNRWLDMLRLPPESNIHTVFARTYPGAAFETLSMALLGRAVTKPSDEPLCVSLLMEIPLSRLVLDEKVEKMNEDRLFENRMCMLWKEIDKKLDGIPIGLLTIGHSRLQQRGFCWAPKTFLQIPPEINLRMHLTFSRKGHIVEEGLLVKSSGFTIRQRDWQDGLRRNPLDVSDPYVVVLNTTFRDRNTGMFYRIVAPPGEYSKMSLQQGPEYAYPASAALAIVPVAEYDPLRAYEAILGKVKDLGNGRHKITEFARLILVKWDQQSSLALSTAEEIAVSARLDSSIRRLNEFKSDQKGSDEFQACLKDVKAFFLGAATDKMQNQDVVDAVFHLFTSKIPVPLACMAFDWFWSDYVAESFGEEKEWCID